MIPKALKDRIIALKLTWNFAKWQDMVIAYVAPYRGLRRNINALVSAIESESSEEIILQRALALKFAAQAYDAAIQKANQP